jgi:hypothetical protein
MATRKAKRTRKARVTIVLEMDLFEESACDFGYDADIVAKTAMDGAKDSVSDRRSPKVLSAEVEWTEKKTYKGE